MTELFNWVFTSAYFVVFLIGLVTCFKETQLALSYRRLDSISLHKKRSYALKAIMNSAISVLGILGLIQAFIGV